MLGECVLGATNAVAGVIETRGWSWDVAWVGSGSMALVLALWWVYFLVPFGQVLHHHRQRAFGWGYGHFAVFASLAAMGAFLGVLADQLKLNDGAAAAAQAHAAVSPTLAIGLVAAAVAVYLVTTWLMSVRVAGQKHRVDWAWGASLMLLAGVVGAVEAGMPLAWSLPALALAPAFLIAVVERGRRRDQ